MATAARPAGSDEGTILPGRHERGVHLGSHLDVRHIVQVEHDVPTRRQIRLAQEGPHLGQQRAPQLREGRPCGRLCHDSGVRLARRHDSHGVVHPSVSPDRSRGRYPARTAACRDGRGGDMFAALENPMHPPAARAPASTACDRGRGSTQAATAPTSRAPSGRSAPRPAHPSTRVPDTRPWSCCTAAAASARSTAGSPSSCPGSA